MTSLKSHQQEFMQKTVSFSRKTPEHLPSILNLELPDPWKECALIVVRHVLHYCYWEKQNITWSALVMGDLVFWVFVSSSPVWPLTRSLCCVFYVLFTVPLSTQEYKLVLAMCQGNPETMLGMGGGAILWWTRIPFGRRGEKALLLFVSCFRWALVSALLVCSLRWNGN